MERAPRVTKAVLQEQLAASEAQNQELIAQIADMRTELDSLREEVRELRAAVPADANATVEQETVVTNETTNENSKSERRSRRGAVIALGAAAVAVVVLAFGSNDKNEKVSSSATPTTRTADKTPLNPFSTETASASSKTTTGGTTAPEAKSTNAKSNGNFQSAENKATAAEAVKTLHSTPETIKTNIHKIFNETKHPRPGHDAGSMAELRSEFKPGHLGATNGAEAAAYAITGSDAYAAKAYNALHGSRSNELPAGVSLEQARQSLENAMTQDGTTFKMGGAEGTFVNYGQRGENVFFANIINVHANDDVLTITTADGKKLYIKETNLCTNILIKLNVKTNKPEKPVTPHTTPGTPKTPETPKHQPKTPETPKPQTEKPEQPKPQPEKPEQPVPEKHPQDKHDNNTTPAGVPGEPKGSGGNGQETTRPQAGNAPAGVGQEQLPLPAPVTPEHNEPTPTGPAETNPIPTPTGPATQGNPGTTAPAGQINPNNTPAGE